MVELTETGITGLDAILGGGIVADATVLVCGTPGTGKSILGMQYLYNGATRFGERGFYLSFEEDADDIRTAAESIGFEEWGGLVEAGDLQVYDKRQLLGADDFSGTLDLLLEELERNGYDRLVVDSLTMFQLFFDDEKEERTYLLKFFDILSEHGLTTLLISEQGQVFPNTDIGLENFLTDGNVYLIQAPTESGVNRYLWVAKMRKQNIDTDVFPIDIAEGGITVYDSAAGFSMIGDDDLPF